MTRPKLRIGARGSPLSLAQTGLTRDALAAALGVDADALEIVPITTSGDRIQDRRLIEAGGKGLFTKELDEALLDGRIDCAVHSMKDLPTKLPAGVALACVPAREDPRDAFVSAKAKALADLPAGARVGTASLRRQAQVLHLRPDLNIAILRGNVATRIQRTTNGDFDATFLGIAGLNRLGMAHAAAAILTPEEMLPAVGQGALAIVCRDDDERARKLLTSIDDATTHAAVIAERAFLDVLDGSCRTPIAAYATIDGDHIDLRGEFLSTDGKRRWHGRMGAKLETNWRSSATALGRALGADIKHRAAIEAGRTD
jgi:hydroxymethylbilane synthase